MAFWDSDVRGFPLRSGSGVVEPRKEPMGCPSCRAVNHAIAGLIPLRVLNLTPGVQKAILFLSETEAGEDPVCERDLREVTSEVD